MKFYKCPICGNIITIVEGSDQMIKCCGESMEELVPNVVDASIEKHLPVYSVDGDFINVKVGEIIHPMAEEHYIMFLAQVISNNEVSIVRFNCNELAEAKFKNIPGSKVYSYCNLHGLWMTELK